MADILSTITDRTQENIMLENVRKCHPTMKQPMVLDLSKDLASPQNVFNSYTRLRELCTPESLRQFWSHDRHYYGFLDTTKWLSTISSCLKKALEAAELLEGATTVVLQEGMNHYSDFDFILGQRR